LDSHRGHVALMRKCEGRVVKAYTQDNRRHTSSTVSTCADRAVIAAAALAIVWRPDWHPVRS
jgi:hypothetical protein